MGPAATVATEPSLDEVVMFGTSEPMTLKKHP